MVAYGEPQIVMFGDGNKKGYTLTQLIQTSNITGHFCEQDNALFLDVFSCKPYEVETAVQCVKDYFEAGIVVRHYMERSIPELQ
jgi:S-adenosylmethionine/arginine decarboxylase-like enzyme